MRAAQAPRHRSRRAFAHLPPLSFHTTGGSKPCGFEPSPASPRKPSATQVAHNHVGWEGEFARGEDRVEFRG